MTQYLELSVYARLHISPKESNPSLRVWTSVEGPPRRWYTITRLATSAFVSTTGGGTSSSRFPVQRIQVPVPSFDIELPADAAIYFNLRTEMKGLSPDERQLGDESSGVACISFAAMVASACTTSQRHPGDSGEQRWFEARGAIKVYNALGEINDVEKWRKRGLPVEDGVPIKGEVKVRGRIRTDTRFAPPTVFDVTPGNMRFLNERITERAKLEVSQIDWAVSESGRSTGLLHSLHPFMPELRNVYAPSFVSPVGVLMPGEHFITQWTQYVPTATECEPWLSGMADSTLAEVRGVPRPSCRPQSGDRPISGIDEDYLVSQTEAMFAQTSSADVAIHLLLAFNVVAMFLGRFIPRTSNACIYKTDLVDLNPPRDGGRGGYSKDLKFPVENFGDPGFCGCGDCEDFAKEMSRVFRMLARNWRSFRRPLLRALGRVCDEVYVACGVLATVTSPSLSGSDGLCDNSAHHIGSPEDARIPTTAHMFVMLLPRGYFLDCLKRSGPLPDGAGPGMSSVHAWDRRVPVVACEGTGHMDPLMLSDMYYRQEAALRDSNGRPAPVPSREERDIVRNQELDCRATEAVLRTLSAGCGQGVCVRAARPQEMTSHDPRVRPGPFYRLAAEIFPIDFEDLVRNALGYELDCSWGLHPPEVPNLHHSPTPAASPAFSYRKLRAVYLNKKNGAGGASVFGKYGVDLLHIIEKRTGIAFLRNPRATPLQECVVRSIMRHLPPDPLTVTPGTRAMEALRSRFAPFAHGISKKPEMRGFAPGPDSNLRWVSVFVPGTDILTPWSQQEEEGRTTAVVLTDGARKLIDTVQKAPYIRGAYALIEAFTPATVQVHLRILVSGQKYNWNN